MKRSASGKAKASTKVDASLLQWVKEAHETAETNNILVQVDDRNMREWDAVLAAKLFEVDAPPRFEYLADNGVYSESFAAVHNRWEDKRDITPSSFQFGAMFYEARIDPSGVMSQRNLATDVTRPIYER